MEMEAAEFEMETKAKPEVGLEVEAKKRPEVEMEVGVGMWANVGDEASLSLRESEEDLELSVEALSPLVLSG